MYPSEDVSKLLALGHKKAIRKTVFDPDGQSDLFFLPSYPKRLNEKSNESNADTN